MESLAPPDPDVLAEVAYAIDVPEDWRPSTVLPPEWSIVEFNNEYGAKYRNSRRELVAIFSCCRENDGQYWLHLSVSHGRRIPLHDEMRLCKELFLGNREAYAVWPPKERYVNLHPHVLHLFARLDDVPVLPDFTKGTRSL
jgi:hypothetical protein